MTRRLYYDEPYLTRFSAIVLKCTEENVGWAIRLDQSAFYPTSGGQPYDTGTLGDAAVTGVIVDADGDVVHYTDRPLAVGSTVEGRIDWERRFDHMQQHAGEHMLANALLRLYGGSTIGLHIGADGDSIDANMPDGGTHLTEEQVRSLEDDVNERIWRDVRIRQWFPEPAELERLPLRKPPTVKEHVRVVQIGEEEYCACGGTHPDSAGQIGLIRILSALPARGKLRLTFLCGKRAYEYLRENDRIAHLTAAGASVSLADLPETFERMQAENRALSASLNAAKREMLLSQKERLLAGSELTRDGIRVVSALFDADPEPVRSLANALCAEGRTVAILGAQSGGAIRWCVVTAEGTGIHAGELLKKAAGACGGKGGGTPSFAQGSGPEGMSDEMRRILGL